MIFADELINQENTEVFFHYYFLKKRVSKETMLPA